MTEEEYRAKRAVLKTRYDACFTGMNAESSPNLKVKWRRRAEGILDEMMALEDRANDELATGVDRTEKSMTEEEFRSRLDELGRRYSACINNMNAMHDRNLHEGWRRRAQGYLDEISTLEHEYRGTSPGSTTTVTAPDEPAVTAPDEPPTLTWIEHHDALVKEWFDGERALINDLYPEPPKKVEDPVFGPLARGVVQAAKILGLVATVFAFFIGLAYALAWIF